MAKNTNFKNKEPLEVQAKRCLLNGMTMTDVEKYLSITRDKVRMINGQITQEDKKTLIGKGLQDCVPESMQQQIAELLKKGRTAKAISQVFNLPVRVINAVGEHRIERVLENIKTSREEIPLVESIVPEIDIDATGAISRTIPTEENRDIKKPSKRGRPNRDINDIIETGEIYFQENQNGKNYREIAKEFGVSKSSVERAVKTYKNKNNIVSARRYVTHHSTININKKSVDVYNNALSKETVIEISELLVKGFTNAEIEAKTGVFSGTISRIRCKHVYAGWTKEYTFKRLRDVNSSFSSRSITRDQLDAVIKMLLEGNTDVDISKSLDINYQTINNIRNHKSYAKFTKDITFPKPNDSLYKVGFEVNADITSSENTDNITKTTEKPIEEIPVEVEINTNEDTQVPNAEVKPTEIGTHKYFASIAKAFAADKFSAILVKHGNMLVYGVENSVKAALLRVISLATPDEVSGCDIYIAGEDKIDDEIINAVKALGVETIIVSK